MQQKKSPMNPAVVRILIAVILLLLSVCYLICQPGTPKLPEDQYTISIVPPTCTDAGYTLYTSKENGATVVDDVVPASGHSFGQWQMREGGTLCTDPDIQARQCGICGFSETSSQYPRTDFPILALSGNLDGIGKTTEVPVSVSFSSRDTSFECFATLKHQGHDSLTFDKKNYTLKLFRDENRTVKNKLRFSHWNQEHKYILKANYIDPSQCRNLIGADLWADVVACRSDLPDQLKVLSNYGAVDGFPIALYVNSEFHGLYTMNLHKDDDLFGMEDGRVQAIMIANNGTSDEAFFKAPATFSGDSPWEVEFCGTADSRWAQDRLNALITFVMESDDETFRSHLQEYLDVESAVDYLLTVYVLGLSNHSAADLVLVTYGSDEPWIVSMYSMGKAFGLSDDGTETAAPEAFLPLCIGSGFDSGTGNLLWDRLLKNFYPQICSRYCELRETVFDPDAICQRVHTYIGTIPAELYGADAAIYPQANPKIFHKEQITQYITRRIPLLDKVFIMEAR